MNKENHLKYKIREGSFELQPETNISTEVEKPFWVSVELPGDCPILMEPGTGEITFLVQKQVNYEQEYRVISRSGEIHIKTEKSSDWQEFLRSNFIQFIGLIISALVRQGWEDFLLVEPGANGSTWFLAVQWNVDGKVGKGMLLKRQKPDFLEMNFWLLRTGKDEKERKQAANKVFNSLTEKDGVNLPIDFPFCRKIGSKLSELRQLTIKLHSTQLWVLLFPIEYFRRFVEYEPFFIYKEVEWVMTDEKSLIRNLCERLTIQNELKKLKEFFEHSVIILNVYEEFEENGDIAEKSREGTALVKEILSLLRDVRVGGEILSIRWHLNPAVEVVISELLNPCTRYFFADFHTAPGTGEWIIPGGKKNSGAQIFEKLKKNTLNHIRLMRVFHCDSVARIEVSGPIPSIVSLLLGAGVLRVEGGIGREDYHDYLCSLLYIFVQCEGLKLCILGKCFETGTNYDVLMKKVDNYLISCNWKLPKSSNAEKSK